MKKGLLIFFSINLLLLNACGTNLKDKESKKRCPAILKSGKFKRVLVEEHKIAVEGDTLKFNEMKFECTTSAFTTQKAMFDNFGKWDKSNFIERTNIPILIWEKIDLFKNGQLFTIMATGDENFETIYGSVIILDTYSKDVLLNDESMGRYSNYFESLIKKNDWSNKEFISLFEETRTSYYSSVNSD